MPTIMQIMEAEGTQEVSGKELEENTEHLWF